MEANVIRYTMRIPTELYEELKAMATKDGRTVHNYMLRILADAVKNKRTP